ncbi:MAG: DUF1810 domain-containing protein [Gammaproteobacteria bacterium HGW-Gammaproteobacteria-1]|jgi:uncharacterized protein (DUF1810 family)|nr:MAG: DUF1810 domain-containing protein [Gammaproteobacteria bacterium HGW-Gammaproteobacteria-1]
MIEDRYRLDRFIRAQEWTYEEALIELRAGKKRSHWMWFIFPQLEGLGRSATAQHYAIKSLDEARAYLAHPLLGERLRECVAILLGLEGRSAEDIFGYPDVLKLHSSLTLFDQVSDGDDIFVRALNKYYGGERDGATLRLAGEHQM